MPAYFENGAFVGRGAWHGEGLVIPEGDPRRFLAREFQLAAQQNYTISRHENFTDYVDSEGNVSRIPTGGYSLVRDKDRRLLNPHVGDGYRILQPSNAFDWFQPWLDTGEVQFEAAGSLEGGAKIWVLARILRDPLLEGSDDVLPYVTLVNSYNGTMARYAGLTGIRIVCSNTMRLAISSKESALFKVRNTKNAEARMQDIRASIDLAYSRFVATEAVYERLRECKITDLDARGYIVKVLNHDDYDALPTRTQNIVDTMTRKFRFGIGNEGKTVWDAFNAVTEYYSHDYGRSDSARLNSLWFGQNGKVLDRALDLAQQLAS